MLESIEKDMYPKGNITEQGRVKFREQVLKRGEELFNQRVEMGLRKPGRGRKTTPLTKREYLAHLKANPEMFKKLPRDLRYYLLSNKMY